MRKLTVSQVRAINTRLGGHFFDPQHTRGEHMTDYLTTTFEGDTYLVRRRWRFPRSFACWLFSPTTGELNYISPGTDAFTHCHTFALDRP